jgi:hypothetical protein
VELPTEYAVFDTKNPKLGLNLVSLVENPAIGFVAIKFSEQKEFKLSVQSEEKRIIFTPVLIPEQAIYREIDGYKFNLKFKAETIEDIAIQFAKDHLSTVTDINHSQKPIDNGIIWFEQFILSGDRVSSVKGYEGIPTGTLFLSGKVIDDQIWEDIKLDKIKGVSIDGNFGISKAPADPELEAALEKLFS